MNPLSKTDGQALLRIARESIRHGLTHKAAPAITGVDGALSRPGACFVSLHRKEVLRGCVGSLEPRRALSVDAAENAFAAAFRDYRMPPVTADELDEIDIEVHVLGTLSALEFDGLDGLYRALRPGEDGLVLEHATRRGVFLPVMWEQLPSPRDFVAHLLDKAGIGHADALGGLRASRFGVQLFR